MKRRPPWGVAVPLGFTDITDRWIERSAERVPARFRLFCFPYAGAGARIFRQWAAELPFHVEICAIRLPGREHRYSEPAFRRSEQVVDSLLPVLRQFLDLPFVMFGHSMGALLAYEVTRGLLATAAVEPRALFVSGHRAPHLPPRRRSLHFLPRDELIAELKALNGTPAEVFQHQDLIDVVLPALRSDLELVETYKAAGGPMLSCPVVAMGGTHDPDVLPEDIADWRATTEGPFKSMLLEGDHFFIHGAGARFLPVLRRELVTLGLA